MAVQPSSATNRLKFLKALNPAWLAGAISIGFHSILFAAGPTFPSLGIDQLTEVELEAERRNVPLVELSAAEQERLPDFSGSFYNFDAFGDLEPLSPLFEGGSGSQPETGNRVLNSKPLLSPGGRPVPPPVSGLPFGIGSLESGRGTISLPAFPTPGSPTPSDSGSGNANGTDGQEDSNSGNSAAESNSPGADALRTDGNDRSSEEAAIAANSNPTDTLSLADRLEAYTFDSTNTQSAEFEPRLDEWLSQGRELALDLEIAPAETVTQAFEQAAATAKAESEADTEASEEAEAGGLLPATVELPIDYQAGICLSEPPQQGLLGAWVSPAGELLGEPEVLRSTGYEGLNQQAIRRVKSLDFSTVESFTGYRFTVVVNYDPEGCVEVGRTIPAAPGATSPSPDGSEASEKAPLKSVPDAPAEQRRSVPAEPNAGASEPGAADADPAEAEATPPAETAAPTDS
ncbi:MAG: hypothetical protein ACFBSG_13610 [Leptolyngbyaceae cyanobacterium]